MTSWRFRWKVYLRLWNHGGIFSGHRVSLSNLPGWRSSGSAESEGAGWDWQFQRLGMLPAGWASDGGKKPIGYQKSCLHDYIILPPWKCFHFPSSFNPLKHLEAWRQIKGSCFPFGIPFFELYVSTFLVFVFSSWISLLCFLHCFFFYLAHRLHVIFLQRSILSTVLFSLFGNWNGVEGAGGVRLGGSREGSQGTDWPLLPHPFPLPLEHMVGGPSPDFPAVMWGM